MTKSDLIAALRAAPTDSVALDHAVHAVLCSWSLPLHGGALQEFEALGRNGGNNYTTSVDVALSTVPKTYAANYLGETKLGTMKFGPFFALLWRRDGRLIDAPAPRCDSAASLPLAVCIAAQLGRAADEVANRTHGNDSHP